MIRSAARRLVATAVLTGGLLVGSTVGAHAQQVVVDDAAGDVVSIDLFGDTFTPEPAIRNGDVVRSRFRHTNRHVTTTIAFTDLRRVGELRGEALRIVTGSGRRYAVDVVAAPGMWRGMALISRANGRPVSCRVDHTIDYDFNLVEVRVPRSCLGNPRFVRVGTGSFWIRPIDFETGDAVAYADDAQRDGVIRNNLKLSKFVRRG